MNKLLLTAAIVALTGLHQPAFAHGDEEHGNQPHETTAEMVMPATTAQESLVSIQAGMMTISVKFLVFLINGGRFVKT